MTKQLLVYLEGNRAIFYGGDLSAMQQADFPGDTVNHLDVLNKDKLNSIIDSFIETNQLLPSSVTLLLSNLITFDKDLSQSPPDQKEKESQAFLDQVPFQNILSYRFEQQAKVKLIAANKDFVLAIKNALGKRGFTVNVVAALSALQEVYPELTSDLNLDLILSKIDSIRQYNMLILQEPTHFVSLQKEKNKQNNRQLYLLLGIFGFLIVVLIIVAVINFAPQKTSQVQVRPTSNLNPVKTQSFSNHNSGSESALANQPLQKVEGISTGRKITPIFFRITRGGH